MDFSIIRESIPLETAAKHYGVETKKGMCSCLVHNEKTPSMKLYKDNYYCFGCGAHGDVIDFTSRLFGLKVYDAALKLVTDFGLKIPIGRTFKEAERKEKMDKVREALSEEKIRRAFSISKNQIRKKLVDLKVKMDEWKYGLEPENMDVPPEEWDERFVAAHVYGDYLDELIDIIDFGENYEVFELWEHRKEVDDFVERIRRIEQTADGNNQTGTSSGRVCEGAT